MEIVEFIIVMFIALLVASVFFYGFRSRGPWGAFWVFLLILFLAGWAGRLWITPAGPLFWGYGWFPVLVFVIIVALLVAGTSPSDDKDTRLEDKELRESRIAETQPEREAGAAFGIFFWLLLIFLFTAIVAGMFAY